MDELLLNQWTLVLLVAVLLVVYGVGHGAFIMRVWRENERLFVPLLLVTSPFGVGLCVLAAVPFIGWASAMVVVAALGVGFVPVAALVIRDLLR